MDEKACFESLLRELAFFYSPRPFSDADPTTPRPENDDIEDAGGEGETAKESSHQLWQLEHVLFPSFRRHTSWPRELLGKDVSQLANLPDLFRIFERC